jgi:hypothetical protein
MVSPKSIELKQGAEDPLMKEAKRCKLNTSGDQEDRPHPLRRACPDQIYRISQPRQRGERPYSRSKVVVHPRHEAEGLQGGVARA